MVKNLFLGCLCFFWFLAIAGGFAIILKYQIGNGSVGRTPENWPAGTKIALDSKRDTLIMFAHPQCPCTRASVEELNRALAQCPGKVTAQVWFFKPRQFSDEWTHSHLWQSAASIPNVAVHEDLDGAQASLFGAETSGYVLLYNNQGKLLFKGGITESRGHAGDNVGEDAIVSLVNGKKTDRNQTQVYGCSILDKCEVSSEAIAK
jgi:hypothetical protein